MAISHSYALLEKQAKMDLIESDATYCSEVEKENISLLRRSKRLSQKLSQSFRSNEDPVLQRFEEIHRMLEIDTTCEGYTKEEWCALQKEVNSIRNKLKRVPRSRLTFVIKKIEQKLRILRIDTNLQEFSKLTNESSNRLGEGISNESVKSPNVLAGMTTELLTEIPPYQPNNFLRSTEMSVKLNLNTAQPVCFQANPLDLTKKAMNVCPQVRQVANDDSRDKYQNTDVLRCPTIDLTKCSQHKENIAPNNECNRLSKDNGTSTPVHTSKWLKYLPTQQRSQEMCEKANISLPSRDKSKPFKHSLISLYRDTTVTADKLKSKKSKSRYSTSEIKSRRKSKHKDNLKRPSNAQYIRNTESVFSRRCGEFESFELRDVQTENFSRLPQETSSAHLRQDVLTFSDNNSSTSLPFSLKTSFKKVFGADILDVLGCEKIVYSLTERHVEKLAQALNVERDFLKVKIEKILIDDGVDENDQSDGSVLECSQSPTPRLHPSQRSQN